MPIIHYQIMQQKLTVYKSTSIFLNTPTCFGPNDHIEGYNLRPKHVGMFKYLIISNIFYEVYVVACIT